MSRSLRIGTRGSPLALAQSEWVRARLRAVAPEHAVELTVISTAGDRFTSQPLSTLGGKGVFVTEIEEALARGSVDCAVHSLKDVPDELYPGLILAAVPVREDARDMLITAARGGLAALPPGTRVGTSSLRRMALVRAARPDVVVEPVRGNVDTRLRKLDTGVVDAVILAAAGLRRLGIHRPDAHVLDPLDFVPAVGQGALAIESRDDEVARVLAALDDAPTRIAVSAERAFLHRVGGSCRTPLAAHATLTDGTLTVRALIASPDGTRIVRGTRSGPPATAAALGDALAVDLLDRGGADILGALTASGSGDGR